MEKVLERAFFNRYYEIRYENNDYVFKLKYKLDENGNPVIPKEPKTPDEVVVLTLPKRPELPNLSCHIKPVSEKTHAEAWKFQTRRVSYEELAGEIGPWGLARKAIEEINEIIKDVYPGYCIIN